jgi:streptomycin 3"-adenylyltransferase
VAEPFGHIGTYVHGSVALGGFESARSDVDELIVVAGALPAVAQATLGARLREAALPCPGAALECSVITAATAASVGECPFEVHLAVSPEQATVVPGAGRGGDPDLVLYVEVCRRSGLVAAGPPAASVFGAVPAERLSAAIAAELEWGLAEASFHYAVLNACRAVRFAVDGALVSKVAGAEWYLRAAPLGEGRDAPTGGVEAAGLVRAALARQLGEPVEEPAAEAVAAFVTAARDFVAAG